MPIRVPGRGVCEGAARHLLGRIPHANKAMVAALIRTVFAQPDRAAASAQLKAAAPLTHAEEEILAYMAFPKLHWQRIYSTNILERVNREIRRRTDVVQVFSSDAAGGRTRCPKKRIRFSTIDRDTNVR